jgi:phage repressor protein C with HTH and peptisase S24 domain
VEHSDFQQRMRKLSEIVGNATTLAKLSGVSRASISLYLSGRSSPTRENLVALAKASGINIEWLATGRGPMQGRQVPELDDYLSIPVRRTLTEDEDGGRCILLRKDFVTRDITGNSGELIFLRARDDSMSPTIDCGDLVLVDRTSGEISDNSICCLEDGERVLFRRVQRLVNGYWCIRSDNGTYADQILADGDLDRGRIVGKAIWAGKRLK